MPQRVCPTVAMSDDFLYEETLIWWRQVLAMDEAKNEDWSDLRCSPACTSDSLAAGGIGILVAAKGVVLPHDESESSVFLQGSKRGR